MDVLIVGANGKTGRLIIPLLLEAGHRPRAMIRAEHQREDMLALGAEPVLGDLEAPLADITPRADCVRHDLYFHGPSIVGPTQSCETNQAKLLPVTLPLGSHNLVH